MFFATYYADFDQGIFRSVNQIEEVKKNLEGKETYTDRLRAYAEHFVHPEDREEYLNVLSQENLRQTLSRKNPYVTFAYRKIPEHADTGPDEYGWIRSTAVMAQADEEGKARSYMRHRTLPKASARKCGSIRRFRQPVRRRILQMHPSRSFFLV